MRPGDSFLRTLESSGPVDLDGPYGVVRFLNLYSYHLTERADAITAADLI